MPAELAELAGVFPIIGNIALKFLLPEFGVGAGSGGVFTAFVPMPIAAVDEDDGVIFRQDDVGLTRQVLYILSEAVAFAVQHGADKHFGFRILAFDLRHVPRALLFAQMIHRRSVGFAVAGGKGGVAGVGGRAFISIIGIRARWLAQGYWNGWRTEGGGCDQGRPGR